MMPRLIAFIYGVGCYLFFLAVFVYLVAFVADVPVPGLVPKTVSHGASSGAGDAIVLNILLMLLFGLQHSIMARSSFKKVIQQAIPPHIERSTYVLVSSLALVLLMWQWQPIDGMVWQFDATFAKYLLWGLFCLGWALIFVATFLTDHFDLFGLRQVYLFLVRRTYGPVEFTRALLYKVVRHPMMLGILISFWAAPTMTLSHMLFSIGMSIYVFIGIHFEERALLRYLGDDYAQWRSGTPMVLPAWPRRKR
ncbi:MAG TPA: NnrU family protein [Burkholderiaceae bacterium]